MRPPQEPVGEGSSAATASSAAAMAGRAETVCDAKSDAAARVLCARGGCAGARRLRVLLTRNCSVSRCAASKGAASAYLGCINSLAPLPAHDCSDSARVQWTRSGRAHLLAAARAAAEPRGGARGGRRHVVAGAAAEHEAVRNSRRLHVVRDRYARACCPHMSWRAGAALALTRRRGSADVCHCAVDYAPALARRRRARAQRRRGLQLRVRQRLRCAPGHMTGAANASQEKDDWTRSDVTAPIAGAQRRLPRDAPRAP